MNRKIETILNLGLTKEEFHRIKPIVADTNMKTLRWVSLLVAIMMYLLTMVTYLPLFADIAVNRSAYLMMGIASTIIYLCTLFLLSKYPVMVKPIYYLFLSMIILFSIYIGVFTNSTQRGSTICVLLLVIPLLLTDKPIRISIFLTISTISFSICSYLVKEENLFSADFLNCVCILVISIAVNFT